MASNSDNYEFAKSATPQSVSSYSAFSDKQYNFINDINNMEFTARTEGLLLLNGT